MDFRLLWNELFSFISKGCTMPNWTPHSATHSSHSHTHTHTYAHKHARTHRYTHAQVYTPTQKSARRSMGTKIVKGLEWLFVACIKLIFFWFRFSVKNKNNDVLFFPLYLDLLCQEKSRDYMMCIQVKFLRSEMARIEHQLKNATKSLESHQEELDTLRKEQRSVKGSIQPLIEVNDCIVNGAHRIYQLASM